MLIKRCVGNIRIARSLFLHCKTLGLFGRADIVEFHKAKSEVGGCLSGVKGLWIPFPVEYKRGKPKKDRCDEVQLCAQALSLEEMLGVEITEGALYYGTPRRRFPVQFDSILRNETTIVAEKLHVLVKNKVIPSAVYEKKCENCSLKEVCMPQMSEKKGTVENYLNNMIDTVVKNEEIS